MDNHLREIRLDVWEAPGRRIESLQLDKMFERVLKWGELHPSTPSSSAVPIPSQEAMERLSRPLPIHPLPQPLRAGQTESPLGRLWEYPELTPLILRHFERPGELAVLCRVSKEWERICRRRLYESIWVRPWEENCHIKLILLLQTLSERPSLCRLVKKLDVRFFPLATRGGDRYILDDQVAKALREMQNLEGLIWTRDKSLTPEIFETIVSLPSLRGLEITGHAYRYYRPHLIGGMAKLEELRIMMPDPLVRDCLGMIVEDLAGRRIGGLKSLGLICRAHALGLHEDYKSRYTGSSGRGGRYPRTELGRSPTHSTSLPCATANAQGLQDLSNLTLPELTTYSLSLSAPHRDPLFLTLDELPRLPSSPRITSLHLTLSGARAHLPAGGVSHILSQVSASTLRSLSLLNFIVSSPQLIDILNQCPKLEELFISTNGRAALLESSAALSGTELEVLHVTNPDPRWGPTLDDLQLLASAMPKCREIGSGTRVYEVHRSGDSVELRRWSKAYTPGYFQVWRG